MGPRHTGYRTQAARLHAAAARLAAAEARHQRARPPFDLIFMTDRRRAPNPAAVIRALRPRSAVIFREYDMPGRERLARSLCALAHSRGVTFLVAGDFVLTERVGADGVHWPSHALTSAPKTTPKTKGIVTAACHNEKEIAAAEALGVDAILLSPIFATDSHPGAPALGLQRAAALARKAARPVFALGGVDATNARALEARGFCGLAAISAFNPQSK